MTRYIKPEGFSPIIRPHYPDGKVGGSNMGENWDKHIMKAEDQTRQSGITRKIRSRPRMPTPLIGTNEIEQEDQIFNQFWPIEDSGSKWNFLTAHAVQDQRKKGTGIKLIMVNTGNSADQEGWRICKNCGKVAIRRGELTAVDQTHHRPYGIVRERIRGIGSNDSEQYQNANNERQSKCHADWSEPTMFGFTFRTDMVILRLKLVAPLNLKRVARNPALKGAIVSIKEAFVSETTRELKLVEREIEGLSPYYPRRQGVAVGKTTDNFVDIFPF